MVILSLRLMDDFTKFLAINSWLIALPEGPDELWEVDYVRRGRDMQSEEYGENVSYGVVVGRRGALTSG